MSPKPKLLKKPLLGGFFVRDKLTHMKIPDLAEAEQLLHNAEARNPGPWIAHSQHVALAARSLAEAHPDLDAEIAYTLGLLHDIGRQEGVTGMRHALDGYTFLHAHGFEDAARICMTHSHPLQNIHAIFGSWDCTPAELAFAETYLMSLTYTPYDELIQLCDALALPEGICLLEKRCMDVALRHGVDDLTVPKWQATLEIQREMEAAIGSSIYRVLPGVLENTFGFDPTTT